MKILIKKCNTPFIVKEFEKLELDDMQNLVGGFIERLECNIGSEEHPSYVDMWLNEEGKLHNLSPNLALVKGSGFSDNPEILDVVMGDVFFTSHDDDGNTVGLNDFQIEGIIEKLGVLFATIHDGDIALVQNFSFV